MKLVSAPGSQDMMRAIRHPLVRAIADIMLSHKEDRTFFKLVALFLKDHDAKTAQSFVRKLNELRNFGQNRPDVEGNFAPLSYIDEIVTKLEVLYNQSQNEIQFQRGAIVELLAFNLVNQRYQNNECLGNQRFFYERISGCTDQIDVAVLSRRRQKIEAYTCKTKANSIESVDCNNLIALTKEALEQDYDIHIGAISFDNSRIIEQRLRRFSGTETIKAYGINNIRELETDPPFLSNK
jgi:hypothetical protein